jgi:hypothetical protein
MTVPRFLSSTFQFNQDLNVVDVATIITNLTTILTGQTPAWTNPSPGVLVSPVDSAGRFMTLTLTRSSATLLVMNLTDQNGILVCSRAFEIIAGPSPTTINYFTGQYHCYLESLTGGSGSGEWLAAMMTDPTDYDLQDNQNFVIGGGTRNNGGAADGAGSVWDQWFMLESGVSQVRQRSRAVSTAPGLNAGLRDFAGNPQFFPFDVIGIPNGTDLWMGSAYQAYQTDLNVAAGTIKPVAIDNATPASFRATVVPANAQGSRLMLRVA